MNILIFLLVISLLIFVHELGHFITAKKRGVLVEEFGIGFPPRILGIKYKETLYSLNLIPIGGFVKLFGEEYYEEGEKENIKNKKLKERMFVNKKPWEKALIITAGVFGNFLLGWLLISFLFTQGVPTPSGYVIVEKVQKNSPAFYSDIKEKDIILKIKYQNKEIKIKSSVDLKNLSIKFAEKPITLVIKRNNQIIEKKITPRKNPPKGEGPLGIIITSFIEKKYPWYYAPFYGLYHAFLITKTIIVELVKTILQIITFQKPNVEVTGPIGIASYTSQAIKFGKNAVLELIALLSLNLAVINLLPFPALDGGRLVFVVYEWITKKKVNKNFEKYTNMFGILVLLTLALLITYNDILKLWK